jgi:hypothetical protein
LSDESVELLAKRTEGWSAGLYLTALWLRDLQNPDEGVRAFAGSAPHVADYLTDEVLTVLAPETRDFLLRTSVLPRFTPGMCDAVLERDDSAAMLAELARSNMFLVELDPDGEWYRYHHLFGELLQLQLGREAAPDLRRRTVDWCRTNGLVEDAIEYAAAAADAEPVAELLVEHHREFVWGGRLTQFLSWVRWLPSELLLEHPSLAAAGALTAALLARPAVDVQRLLGVAKRARRERPQRWSPYLETIVEVTRATAIERGGVGSPGDQLCAHAGPDGLLEAVDGTPRARPRVRTDRTPRRSRTRSPPWRAAATFTAAHHRSCSRPARARANPRRTISAGACRPRPCARKERSQSFPILGAYRRSRLRSNASSPPPERMSETDASSRTPARPSLPCCAASLPSFLGARSARACTSH